jgi:hypothetical protein
MCGAAPLRAAVLGVVLVVAIAGLAPSLTLAAPQSGDDPPAKDDGGPTTRKSKGRPSGGESADKKTKKRDGGGGKVDMSDVAADEKAEQQALEALGDLAKHFKIKRTMHFSMLYDTGDEDLGVFSVAIEKTYRSCAKFSNKLGVQVRPPKRKLIIHYFSELTDFSGHLERSVGGKPPDGALGLYKPIINMSYFFNYRNSAACKRMRADAEAKIKQLGEQARRSGISPVERKRLAEEIKRARAILTQANGLGEDVGEVVIQHEVAHQVLYNIGFHNQKRVLANPHWLVEGMAQLFEPGSTDKAANMGLVNQHRLQAFRQLARTGKLVPLRDFISTSSYFKQPDVAYPESWALVHYITRVKGDELKEFVRLVNKRPKDYQPTPEDEVATFERAFGKIDDQWVANWLKWMEKVR